MLELSAYSAALFAHVVSGVFLVGSSLFAPVARILALEAPTLPELRAHLTCGRRASTWTPLAAMVVLASGGYLGSYGWGTQPWFFVALAAWLASTLLAVAVVRRIEDALSRVARAADQWLIPADADGLRRSRRWTLALASILANDASMILVMYAKPGLAGALGIVALGHALAIGALLARHRAAAKMVTLTISQS